MAQWKKVVCCLSEVVFVEHYRLHSDDFYQVFTQRHKTNTELKDFCVCLTSWIVDRWKNDCSIAKYVQLPVVFRHTSPDKGIDFYDPQRTVKLYNHWLDKVYQLNELHVCQKEKRKKEAIWDQHLKQEGRQRNKETHRQSWMLQQWMTKTYPGCLGDAVQSSYHLWGDRERQRTMRVRHSNQYFSLFFVFDAITI